MLEYKSYVVVVDPFYSHLIRQLVNDGVHIIGVYSDYKPSDKVFEVYPFNESDFDMILDASTKQLYTSSVKKLKSLNVSHVINGLDTGTAMWVQLGNDLELPNALNITLSDMLRNKFTTTLLLNNKSIPVGRHLLIDQSSDIKECLQHITNVVRYPVVVKPTKSASSFGVHLCSDEVSAKKAIKSTLGITDVIFGTSINELVIEEELIGIEYNVCSIVSNGVNKVAAIYEYAQYLIDGIRFPRRLNLIDPQSKIGKQAVNYSSQVVNALDYHHGAATIEMILTSDGMKLVELNPRVAGLMGYLDQMVMTCTGHSHISIMSDSVQEDPVRNSPLIYNKKKHGTLLFLRHYKDGKANALGTITEIFNLPSVNGGALYTVIGETHTKTTDCNNAAGFVILVNDSIDALEKDIEKISLLEKSGLFIE
jgi:hypothetical protein